MIRRAPFFGWMCRPYYYFFSFDLWPLDAFTQPIDLMRRVLFYREML